MLAGIEDVETVGTLWFAAPSFGVQLHDNDLHASEALVLFHSKKCHVSAFLRYRG